MWPEAQQQIGKSVSEVEETFNLCPNIGFSFKKLSFSSLTSAPRPHSTDPCLERVSYLWLGQISSTILSVSFTRLVCLRLHVTTKYSQLQVRKLTEIRILINFKNFNSIITQGYYKPTSRPFKVHSKIHLAAGALNKKMNKFDVQLEITRCRG